MKRYATHVPLVLAGMFLLGLSALLTGSRAVRAGQSAPATQPTATTAPGPEKPEGWFAPAPRTNSKPPPEEARRAFIIPIHGPIGSATYEAVKRKAIRCRASGADLIIFDMNTPGGRSDMMERIVRLILQEFKDIYAVAYVNPSAYSAGAIISLACDEIALCPTAVIGDAMPIMLGPQGIVPIPDKERGKIESAALAQIRVLAKRNGYSEVLCEAMITITREVWLIRNIETRQLRTVNANEWRGRVLKEPATTRPVKTTADPAARKQWQYIKTIVDDNKLVTMTADEAVFLGFGKYIADSMEDLTEHFNVQGKATILTDTWSEKLVAFLTSAPVVSFLLFVALLCGYLEMHTPGFGVAGAIAIACFALIFGSGFLVGLAAWWEIALFVVGLALIAIEVFMTPGFGVLGITGGLCCLVGLLAMLIPNAPDKWPIPRTEIDWNIFVNGLTAIAVGFLMACAAAVLLARYLPKVPIASRLLLAVPDVSGSSPATERAPIRNVRAGATGTVEGPCRPVGQVRFGQELVDAIADGGFIPAGAKVKAIKVEGNRVVVTPVA